MLAASGGAHIKLHVAGTVNRLNVEHPPAMHSAFGWC